MEWQDTAQKLPAVARRRVMKISSELTKNAKARVLEALIEIREGFEEQLLMDDDGNPVENSDYDDWEGIQILIGEFE